MTDAVNRPAHYTAHPSGVECITITEHFGFSLGNAIKYIWRAGLKSADALEDLRKARWYVDREIARLEAAAGPTITRSRGVWVAAPVGDEDDAPAPAPISAHRVALAELVGPGCDPAWGAAAAWAMFRDSDAPRWGSMDHYLGVPCSASVEDTRAAFVAAWGD